MILRRTASDPRRIVRLGSVFLIVASLEKLFLHRAPALSPDLADGLVGLFYGLAIGTLLLGLWMGRKARTR